MVGPEVTKAVGFTGLGRRALGELGGVLERVDPAAIEALASEIAAARRIAVFGLGREGLMMQALAMRLFHLGLDVHVVGDMTVPPLGVGDLLLASAGPGAVTMVEALVHVARDAGARTLCITAQPDGTTARAADACLVLPAQTMADDTAALGLSILPMGSLFEGVQFLAFELLVILLRDRLGVTPEQMRANHTNLE